MLTFMPRRVGVLVLGLVIAVIIKLESVSSPSIVSQKPTSDGWSRPSTEEPEDNHCKEACVLKSPILRSARASHQKVCVPGYLSRRSMHVI
jgi:hypothetical protein